MGQKIGIQERWQGLVRAHQASGLKVEEFCRREKIYSTSFYGWRKRLGMAKVTDGSAVSTPKSEDKSSVSGSPTKGFMRLMPPATGSGIIRIETANGYKVDTGYVGEDGLKNVLRVLQAL